MKEEWHELCLRESIDILGLFLGAYDALHRQQADIIRGSVD